MDASVYSFCLPVCKELKKVLMVVLHWGLGPLLF